MSSMANANNMLPHIIGYVQSKIRSLKRESAAPAAEFMGSRFMTAADMLDGKTANDLIADHSNSLVFSGTSVVANIKPEWWQTGTQLNGSSALYRLIGEPTHLYCPPFDVRHDSVKYSRHQGLLCSPSNGLMGCLTPIEQLAQTYFLSIADCGVLSIDSKEFFNGLVQIYTCPYDMKCTSIEVAKIMFVKPGHNVNMQGNRHDIVRFLQFDYLLAMIVYLSNPVGFLHCDPLRVIINIFTSQKNFFPVDIDMPLSDSEKHNFLFSLGMQVAEVIRQSHADFYVDNKDIFPVNSVLTEYPSGYQSVTHQTFMVKYFLFSNVSNEEERIEDHDSVPFDQDMLEMFNASDANLKSFTWENLRVLVRMIFPLQELVNKKHENFGFTKSEAIMKKIVKQRDIFITKHKLESYMTELGHVS
jgi:hypothetical protein